MSAGKWLVRITTIRLHSLWDRYYKWLFCVNKQKMAIAFFDYMTSLIPKNFVIRKLLLENNSAFKLSHIWCIKRTFFFLFFFLLRMQVLSCSKKLEGITKAVRQPKTKSYSGHFCYMKWTNATVQHRNQAKRV